MLDIISGIFIKNNKNYENLTVRRAYGTLAGTIGIILNILLFAGKLTAGTMSGSIAIIADAFNNLSDAGSSIITLIGFRLSAHRPDIEHPFGHGRIEYISGMLVSVVILMMGLELINSSVSKLLHPEPIDTGIVVIVILVASIVIKLFMFYYNRVWGGRIDSAALKAAATDSLSDTAATALVLAATIISKFTGLMLDGWFGIIVGLFIIYTGGSAMKDVVDLLIGRAPDSEFIEKVKEIVLSHSKVHGLHDLIVHDYGPGCVMISLHAEVDADGDIRAVHEQIDHIENEIQRELNCSVTIHTDPIVTDDEEVLYMRRNVETILGVIDTSLSMHDFRIVREAMRKILVFDIQVPRKCRLSDNEIVNRLKSGVSMFGGGEYSVVVHVDHGYYLSRTYEA